MLIIIAMIEEENEEKMRNCLLQNMIEFLALV